MSEQPTLGPDPGDGWADHLEITESAGDDGTKVFVMDLSPDHLNFLAGAHGGALFSLAETAVRRIAASDGPRPRVVDAHLSLTAGGEEGDTFTATVESVNVGRSLGVYRAHLTRRDGRVVGEFTGTVRFSG